MKRKILLLLIGAMSAAVTAAPTIDGVLGGGEWAGATKISIAGGNGTVWAIAHADYLYAAYDITGDTKDGRLSHIDPFEKLGINIFGPKNTYIYSDITLEIAANPGMWLTSAGSIDGYGATLWSVDSTLPGDLQTKSLYGAGHRVTELMIPLDSLDPLKVGEKLRIVGAVQFGNIPYRYPAATLAQYAYIPVVPEPGVMLLVGFGTVMVGWLRRRQTL